MMLRKTAEYMKQQSSWKNFLSSYMRWIVKGWHMLEINGMIVNDIDSDDGVKVNYEKFQGVEVAQEGKKALKVDLLAKIK